MIVRLMQVVSVLSLVAMTTSASAIDPARPCGPDSMTGPLRLLVPQEFHGADFRPACRKHDACYEKLGVNKAACDRQYLKDMECACNNSRHPVLCRMLAKTMYKSVTGRGGDRAFAIAQKKAKRRALAK